MSRYVTQDGIYIKGELCMIFIISSRVVHKLIMYSDTLKKKNYKRIPRKRDDDIRASHIPVMWQCTCISIAIPLAKQVHLCKIYACYAEPFFFFFLEPPTVEPRPEGHMGMIPPEVLLRNIHLIPQDQTVHLITKYS